MSSEGETNFCSLRWKGKASAWCGFMSRWGTYCSPSCIRDSRTWRWKARLLVSLSVALSGDATGLTCALVERALRTLGDIVLLLSEVDGIGIQGQGE